MALEIVTAEQARESGHHVEVPIVAFSIEEGTECVEDEERNVTEEKRVTGCFIEDHDYARKDVLGNYTAESILVESAIVASEVKHAELDIGEKGATVRGDIVLEQAGEARIKTT